jgi:hypothetical protein
MKIDAKIIALVFQIVLLASCDPGLINKYVVENESDYVIEASFRLKRGHRNYNSSDTIQLIKIAPQSRVKIIEYGEIGMAYNKKQQFLEAFDTIVLHSIRAPIKIDIRDWNNWEYHVINEGLLSIDEVEYRIVIKNQNLKK